MKLYILEKRFHPKTGKELDPQPVESKNFLCDFTGGIIDCEKYENRPLYEIKIDYNHDCEEIYYYDEAKDWFRKQRIGYASIFESPFHFKPAGGRNNTDASVSLMAMWVRNCGSARTNHWLAGASTIEEAMRRSRVRLVKQFIEEKRFTPDELGLEGDY